MDVDQLNRIIHKAYEVAFDDHALQYLVNELSDSVFFSASAIVHDASTECAELVEVSRDIDTQVRDQAVALFSTPEKNPGVAAVLRSREGQPFFLESFANSKMVEEHEGIRFFFHPHNFDKALMVTVKKDVGKFSHISLFRQKRHDAFDDRHETFLKLLAPHVKRSLKFRDLRRSARLMTGIQEVLLNNNYHVQATLVVDQNCKLIEADQAAEALLKKADVICRSKGRIISASKRSGQDTESLHRYLGQTGVIGRSFFINGANGVTLRLSMFPVSSDICGREGAGLRAVIIDIVRGDLEIDYSAFAGAYFLTPAEIRFVEILTKSSSATDAARTIGISRNTAKTHLSNIFQKTGTNSQSQLMLMLGRFSQNIPFAHPCG